MEKRVGQFGKWGWMILCLTALFVRLGAASSLPNAELDGYSYAETIALYSERLAAGQFHLVDLYGFWLPLFQLVAAILNLGIHNSLLAGQLLSAVCGAAACVLVFAVTRKLTGSLWLGLCAFGLALINPLHVLYSAAAMTDVPFGCLLLASLWFALHDRWLNAAIFAALAGCVRVEAWALIPVLPVLQFVREKRVSVAACVVLLLPPCSWLLICYAATGDFFAYFAKRASYQAVYLAFHSTRSDFAPEDLRRDAEYFLVGANQLVCAALAVSVVVLFVQAIRGRRETLWKPTLAAAYPLSIILIMLSAYLTKRQPVILPRYGLFCFVLGLPLLAWLFQLLVGSFRSPRLGWLIVAVLVAAIVQLEVWQLPMVRNVRQDFEAHQSLTKALISEWGKTDHTRTRCFTDDVAIRVLSRLPRDRFLRSETTPEPATQDPGAFLSYLRAQNVSHLVFLRTEASLPVEFFPELGRATGRSTQDFQFVAMKQSDFGPSIWLYRLRKEPSN